MLVFSTKICFKVVVGIKCENMGSHSFPCRSLLLSTIVLNDIHSNSSVSTVVLACVVPGF